MRAVTIVSVAIRKLIGDFNRRDRNHVFIVLTAVLLLSAGLFVIITCNSQFLSLVWNGDTTGLFPDYFQSLWHAYSWDPYGDNAVYPPLMYLVLYVFATIIPGGVGSSWWEPSTTAAGSLSYILFMAVALLILKTTLMKKIENRWTSLLFILLTVFSAGTIYCIERGNTMPLVCAFMAIFIIWYDSSEKKNRILAIISLIIAINLRLYPAILLLLYLGKDNRMLVRIGVVSLVVMFVTSFVYGGPSAFIEFLQNALNLGSERGAGETAFGNGFLIGLLNTFRMGEMIFVSGEVANGTILTAVNLAIMAIIALSMIYGSLFFTEKWKRVCCMLTLLIAMTPVSWQYNVLYILPAFVLFMSEKAEMKGTDVIYLILFVLMLAPFPYGFVADFGGFNPVSWSALISSVSVLLMCLLIMYDAQIQRKKAKANGPSHADVNLSGRE